MNNFYYVSVKITSVNASCDSSAYNLILGKLLRLIHGFQNRDFNKEKHSAIDFPFYKMADANNKTRHFGNKIVLYNKDYDSLTNLIEYLKNNKKLATDLKIDNEPVLINYENISLFSLLTRFRIEKNINSKQNRLLKRNSNINIEKYKENIAINRLNSLVEADYYPFFLTQSSRNQGPFSFFVKRTIIDKEQFIILNKNNYIVNSYGFSTVENPVFLPIIK